MTALGRAGRTFQCRLGNHLTKPHYPRAHPCAALRTSWWRARHQLVVHEPAPIRKAQVVHDVAVKLDGFTAGPCLQPVYVLRHDGHIALLLPLGQRVMRGIGLRRCNHLAA